EHWQAMGVDGFRCDMAHMVPPEFWNWAIAQARARQVDVVFIGEAYDNDPAKVPGVDPIISKLHGGRSNVMFDLLNAGFNAVYDDQTYRALKKSTKGPAGPTISMMRGRTISFSKTQFVTPRTTMKCAWPRNRNGLELASKRAQRSARFCTV